ncbi:hypothetical protein MY11210_007652 [Beauveria gryllotalpidicola]
MPKDHHTSLWFFETLLRPFPYSRPSLFTIVFSGFKDAIFCDEAAHMHDCVRVLTVKRHSRDKASVHDNYPG